MNIEDSEFQRIEAEAKRRAQAAEDNDIQNYKKPWVGLTDEDIDQIMEMGLGVRASIETALDKHEEKNT